MNLENNCVDAENLITLSKYKRNILYFYKYHLIKEKLYLVFQNTTDSKHHKLKFELDILKIKTDWFYYNITADIITTG